MNKVELEALENLLISNCDERTKLIMDYKQEIDKQLYEWKPYYTLSNPSSRIQVLNVEIELLERLIKGYK